jgi:hypothetical protein|tara:strand:+ start:468 stop:776 length:309 start_codon:yes stop_codon:yes gene_type:complete
MFRNTRFNCPSLNNWRVSILNEENVVKEPRIPININADILSGSSYFSVIAQSVPIRRLPIRFTASVPQGKPNPNNCETVLDRINLDTAPIAPPVAMKKKVAK